MKAASMEGVVVVVRVVAGGWWSRAEDATDAPE